MFDSESNFLLIRYLVLGLLLVLSVAGDIRNYKIHNLTVAAGLTAGVAISLVSGGSTGLLFSILAAFVPAVLLIVLFALRMLGAGDIKLFCAIGSIMGIPYIFFTMAYSFIAGGVIALAIMFIRGNIKQRLHHISAYLKSFFLTGKLGPYTEFSNKGDGAKFHFSIAIAAGCVIQSVLMSLR